MKITVTITIAFLALTPMLFAAEKAAPAIYQGKLIDFTEERYVSSGIPGPGWGMGSCVNRDYTVELEDRIVMLRQSTCRPGLNPALKCVVGRNVQVVIDPPGSSILNGAHDERYGLVANKGVMSDSGGKGKPVWLKLFKTTMK